MYSIRTTVIAFILLFVSVPPALATTPPIWRDPITNGDTLLFGNLAGTQNVNQALGFTFPFQAGAGSTSTITIGTNGAIALGGGELLQNNIWQNTAFESNFTFEGTPRILAFSTGLNHFNDTTAEVEGVYFFSNNVDRAYITWYRVAGTGDTNNALISFQVQLRADGTIVLGYDAEAGANFLASLNSGIIVGVSTGMSTWPPGSSDFTILSGSDINAGATVYEIWCRNGNVNDCFQQNGTDTHDAFDLDGRNVVFNPTPGIGYTVSRDIKAGVDAGACISIAANPGPGSGSFVSGSTSGSSGGGGGGSSVAPGFLIFLGLLVAFARARNRNS